VWLPDTILVRPFPVRAIQEAINQEPFAFSNLDHGRRTGALAR
jgi:hypothetical protein